jgi:uncharacterized membrane protein AbrB (regulator of aidB expression)
VTTYQAIALFFPIAGAIGAALTALLAKKLWVDRPILVRNVGIQNVGAPIASKVGQEDLKQATQHVQQALRELEQAMKQ